MKIVCQHCKRVLRETDDGCNFGEISHSDCMGYLEVPCLESISYHEELAAAGVNVEAALVRSNAKGLIYWISHHI